MHKQLQTFTDTSLYIYQFPYHTGGSGKMSSKQEDYEERQLEHLVEGRERDLQGIR
jgi:hypothetical protein